VVDELKKDGKKGQKNDGEYHEFKTFFENGDIAKKESGSDADPDPDKRAHNAVI
jgi:hypothetical protein